MRVIQLPPYTQKKEIGVRPPFRLKSDTFRHQGWASCFARTHLPLTTNNRYKGRVALRSAAFLADPESNYRLLTESKIDRFSNTARSEPQPTSPRRFLHASPDKTCHSR